MRFPIGAAAKSFFGALLLLGVFANSSIAKEFGLIDATRTSVKVTDHPIRIVTLAPSLGEMVADLLSEPGGSKGRLVGVTEYTDFPPELKKIDSVGPYHQFNVEKVVSLKPDLVLATLDGNPKDRVLRLRELGIPVVVVTTRTFDEVEDSILLIGRALGTPQKAKEKAAQLRNCLSQIRKESSKNAPVRVLLQVGADPLVAAGQKSFLNESLEWVGAKNIYSDSNSSYPQPSIEDIVVKNPDVILIMALGTELGKYEEMKKKWLQLPRLKAVKNQKVHILKSDELLRPTLRLLEGLSRLNDALYKGQSHALKNH